jgi:hypothetical protein
MIHLPTLLMPSNIIQRSEELRRTRNIPLTMAMMSMSHLRERRLKKARGKQGQGIRMLKAKTAKRENSLKSTST